MNDVEMTKVGTKVYSGNTFNPTVETVVGVYSWVQLTEQMRDGHRVVEHWLTAAQQADRLYVVLYNPSRREGWRYSSAAMDVFIATRYESEDAMIRAYAEKSAGMPAHNPFCGLPGGY